MGSEHRFRYLSQEDVAACGGQNMEMVISSLEQVLIEHARGNTLLPPKNVMRWGGAESEAVRGRFNSMPGYVGGEFEVAGIKWISGMPTNPRERRLPRGIGLTILNDPVSGLPLAILEGTLLSAMRTGGVSGLAARVLAVPDAASATLIGAGVISLTTASALSVALPNLDHITVCDLDSERADRLAKKIQDDLDVRCSVKASTPEAVEGADVVVTATTAKEPIIELDMLSPKALYIQVGGYECTAEVIDAADKNVVDDWEQVAHRGTQTVAIMHEEGRFSPDRLHGELGEVLAGDIAGREDSDQLIVCTPIGLGIEDLGVAKLLLEEAERRDIGTTLPLWEKPFAI